MKNKIPVQSALERASQLAYSLENALRASKADYKYTLDTVVKLKNLIVLRKSIKRQFNGAFKII